MDPTRQALIAIAKEPENAPEDQKVLLKLQGRTLVQVKPSELSWGDKFMKLFARFGIGNFSLSKIVSFVNKLETDIPELAAAKERLIKKIDSHNSKAFTVKITEQLRPKLDLDETEEEEIPPQPIGMGIVNGGNSCYLNSVVQALRFVPIPEKRGQLRELHARLQDKTVSAVEINAFRKKIIEMGMDNADDSSQEDASEACEIIFKDLGIPQLFYYSVGEEAKEDHMLRLPIDLDLGDEIQALTQNIRLEELPDMLPIQLGRFSEENGGKKRSNIVRPSAELVIQGSNDDEVANYKLASIVVHSGSTIRSGHYYTYVPQQDGSWICYNDSSVHKVSNEEVMNDVATNGYLFFYKKF